MKIKKENESGTLKKTKIEVPSKAGVKTVPTFLPGFMSAESVFAMINITNKGLTKRLLMLTDQKYNDV